MDRRVAFAPRDDKFIKTPTSPAGWGFCMWKNTKKDKKNSPRLREESEKTNVYF
jgi:hypothetical protein